MKTLLVNAIITPDGTVLQSNYRHDYVSHKDSNGETYFVDGGLSYVRRSINTEKATDLSLYDTDPHESLREWFSWGTRGALGDEPLSWIKLKNLTDKHIEAILETQQHISNPVKKLLKNELAYRTTSSTIK